MSRWRAGGRGRAGGRAVGRAACLINLPRRARTRGRGGRSAARARVYATSWRGRTRRPLSAYRSQSVRGQTRVPSRACSEHTSVTRSSSLVTTSCPRNIVAVLTRRSSSNLGIRRASCGLWARRRSVDISTPSFCVSAGGIMRSRKVPSVCPLSSFSSRKRTWPHISSYKKRNPLSSRPPRSSNPWPSHRSRFCSAGRPTSAPSGLAYEIVVILPIRASIIPSETHERSSMPSKAGTDGAAGRGTASSTSEAAESCPAPAAPNASKILTRRLRRATAGGGAAAARARSSSCRSSAGGRRHANET